MSISQRQIEIAKERAITSFLEEGRQPYSANINALVASYFRGKMPGAPFYRPLSVEEYECSDPNTYNDMFSSLGEDLQTIFKENGVQANKVTALVDYYITEKGKVNGDIDKLFLRLDNIDKALKKNKVTEGFVENFNDFYSLELYGEPDRSIPSTTAFIDLTQKRVYNEKLTMAKEKLNISSASVIVKPISSIVDHSEIGEAKNILSDMTNENYIYVAKRNSNEECAIEVKLVLEEPVTATTISISVQTTKAMNVKASYSEDDIVYKDHMDLDTESNAEWNFNKSAVKFITIRLNKIEPDGYNGTEYEYYFTLKNISILRDSYMSKGVLVTAPITTNTIPNDVLLLSDDVIHPNTDIKYFIGKDDFSNKIEWKEIQNGITYDLGILRSERKLITAHTADYGDFDNGCYNICSVPLKISTNSIDVKTGYQMWYRETVNIPTDISSESTFVPSLVHYSSPVSYEYIDCDKYSLDITAGTMQVLTQYIVCDKPYVVSQKKITGTIKRALYVNNIKVPEANGEYSLYLNQGTNKIQVLVFSDTDASFSHNFNLTMISFDVYAGNPLRHVSEYTLRYKTPPNDSTSFAISDKGYIIVKTDPKSNVINKTGNNDKLKYLVNYKYVPEGYGDKFSFRLMAVLTSSTDDLSPQILSYRIIAE